MYYRVYIKGHAVKSKKPADSAKPLVGRINVDSVPPPHTAASIIRCISKTEQLANLKYPQLYFNTESGSPIGDEHVSILTDSRPGSTAEDPIAFVESPDPPPREQKRRTTKQMRVINVSRLSMFQP